MTDEVSERKMRAVLIEGKTTSNLITMSFNLTTKSLNVKLCFETKSRASCGEGEGETRDQLCVVSWQSFRAFCTHSKSNQMEHDDVPRGRHENFSRHQEIPK